MAEDFVFYNQIPAYTSKLTIDYKSISEYLYYWLMSEDKVSSIRTATTDPSLMSRCDTALTTIRSNISKCRSLIVVRPTYTEFDSIYADWKKMNETRSYLLRPVLETLCYNQGFRTASHPRYVADMNGDGRSDLIAIGWNQVYVALTKSDGSGSYAPTEWVTGDFAYNQGWRTDRHVRLFADVDGDGKSDLVAFGEDGVWVAKSTGSGLLPKVKWTSEFGYNTGWRVNMHVRCLADVNGDGKADIVGFGESQTYVALAKASGGFQTAQPWTSYFTYNTGWRVDLNVRCLADVNGDGKADIIGFGESQTYVALSTGSGFETPKAVSAYFTYNTGWRNINQRFVADINGDKRGDLIGFGDAGVYVAINTGSSSFSAPSLVISTFGTNQGWANVETPRMVGDFDGNKLVDFIGFAWDKVYVGL